MQRRITKIKSLIKKMIKIRRREEICQMTSKMKMMITIHGISIIKQRKTSNQLSNRNKQQKKKSNRRVTHSIRKLKELLMIQMILTLAQIQGQLRKIRKILQNTRIRMLVARVMKQMMVYLLIMISEMILRMSTKMNLKMTRRVIRIFLRIQGQKTKRNKPSSLRKIKPKNLKLKNQQFKKLPMDRQTHWELNKKILKIKRKKNQRQVK